MDVLRKSIPYKFKDPSLLDHRSYVGGRWVESSSKKTFKVLDPVDDEVVAEVTDLTREDVGAAIEIAHKAFQVYKKMTARQRRLLLREWIDAIKANKEDLAAICTIELAKPFSESLVTVEYGLSFLERFEGLIELVGGETIPAARNSNRIFTIRQPQGVVAAITPWNSPIAMITRKVGAAISTGNTVVCKPAPETPLCAIALAKLFERATGYPPGVFNVVTSSLANTPAIGEELCANKLVRHLSFTGSSKVGMFLNGECGKSMKRTSMELGGNAPFIVFDDANLLKAADGLISSKFRSSGQTCVCANRILVHESIMDEFVETLRTRSEELLFSGSVWDRKTNFGPLYSAKGVEKVRAHLDDALSKGYRLVAGGVDSEHEYGPNYVPPTILVNDGASTATAVNLRLSKEETFGPVAILIPFRTEEEAIAYANDTDAGLAAYFYTEDLSRTWRVAESLETGMVGIRVGLVSACEQPFGGIKTSGSGREGGGVDCLEEYTELKSITLGL